MLLRFATYLSPSLEHLYRAVSEHVCARLGCATELVVGTSFDQIRGGEVDFAFICGYPYVKLARGEAPLRAIAAPVLAAERYEGKPVYYSDVIVRRDDPVAAFEQLRGCTWCFNDEQSHSGYLTVLHHLVSLGQTPAFFGRFEPVGFHLEAMRLVADGSYEASAIDSQVLAVAHRDVPELTSRLRVIDAIGPSSIQPLVAGDHVDPDLCTAVGEAVTTMHASLEGAAALAGGLVERFAPVTDATYDDIRGMVAAVERAGLLVP